jgi:hypothetical protein
VPFVWWLWSKFDASTSEAPWQVHISQQVNKKVAVWLCPQFCVASRLKCSGTDQVGQLFWYVRPISCQWSEHQHSIFVCEELEQSYLNPWNLTNWYPCCAWFQKLDQLHYCVSVMEFVFLTSQCPSFSWDICMIALIGSSLKSDFLAPSYQYSTLPLTRVSEFLHLPWTLTTTV